MATRKVTTKRRRVRPRKTVGVAISITRKAETKLDNIRDLMVQQEALALELQEAKDDLEKYMKAEKLDKVSLEDIVGEIKAPIGRKVNTVRVAEFREAVSDEEFMESITVSVTEARKVLSGKALDAICDVTLPKEKPPVLTVKMVKPKKG